MTTQLLVKILLIAAFAILAIYLILPVSGQRGQAIRKIVYALLFVGAVFAVIFPNLVSTIAEFVGVGRGTDLLLYGLIVVFLGTAFSLRRRTLIQERSITDLARAIAISNARTHD